MRLSLAAARKHALIIMYALINGNKICTRAIYPIQITAGLEAEYLIKSVVRSLQIFCGLRCFACVLGQAHPTMSCIF